jgi:hypothetical protein
LFIRLTRIENTALFVTPKQNVCLSRLRPWLIWSLISVWGSMALREVRRASDAHCPVQRSGLRGACPTNARRKEGDPQRPQVGELYSDRLPAGMGIQPTPSEAIGQRRKKIGDSAGSGSWRAVPDPHWQVSGPQVTCSQPVRPRPLCASAVPDRPHPAKYTVSKERRTSPGMGTSIGLTPRRHGLERSQHIEARSHSYDMTSSLLCN